MEEHTFNSEKMERPHPWPDPPEIKFPELFIPCSMSNDVKHRMMIFMDKAKGKDYSVKSYFIKCDKCGTFKLMRTKIIEKDREYYLPGESGEEVVSK